MELTFETTRIPGQGDMDTVEVKLINTGAEPTLAKIRMTLDTRPVESGMFQLVAGMDSKVIFTVAKDEEILSVQMLDSGGKPIET